LMDGRNCLS